MSCAKPVSASPSLAVSSQPWFNSKLNSGTKGTHAIPSRMPLINPTPLSMPPLIGSQTFQMPLDTRASACDALTRMSPNRPSGRSAYGGAADKRAAAEAESMRRVRLLVASGAATQLTDTVAASGRGDVDRACGLPRLQRFDAEG